MSDRLQIENPTGDVLKDCILELIGILKESCTQYAEAAGGDDHEHKLFDPVDMNRLAELENVLRGEQLQNNWISVKDRLPEAIGSCLVHFSRGSIERWSYLGDELEFSDAFLTRGRVTHWQPLPSPPEAK